MTTSVASQGSLVGTDPPSGGGMALSGVGTDSLQDTVAGMSKHQLYQLVSQMKNLIHQNQQQARQILIDNPQLTKTLFQAQIMLGMVRAPGTPPPPLASAPARSPQPPPTSAQLPLEAPPAPTSQLPAAASSQTLPNQQPAPSPAPSPQMASTYLQQQSQVSGGALLQPPQPSFSYQQSLQQSTPPANPVQQLHSQPLVAASSTLQPSIQHGTSQPLHPPLPQQPRPSVAPAPHMQHSNTQAAVGFTAHPSQPYQTTQSSYLQQGGPPQNNAGSQFQQMLTPSLPQQQLFQVPRSGGAMEAGRGLSSMGIIASPVAPLMTWNQAIPSSVPVGIPQVPPVVGGATMNTVVPGHHPFNQTGSSSSMVAPGPNLNPPPQVYNQALAQAQPPPQQLQHQPQGLQMQMPIELEQQKALLQQVMNLTPEQINSLPPEQRQQVLQLQQAFRSQSG